MAPGSVPDPREGQVWVLGADDGPQPVSVRLGLSDGTSTEVLAGALGESQRVIIGSDSAARSPAQTPGGFRLRF
jgi:HlyD family secretion protein